MLTILRLMRWEWFKLRRRWMPWILVAVAIAICQSFLWSQFYEYRTRVPFHEESFFNLAGPVVAEDGRRAVIPISCLDIWDGTVDEKVARSAPELKEETLELVRSMREEHCPASLEREKEFGEYTQLIIVLPNSISNSFGIAQGIGSILVMILAGSAMGSEYGWGTLRGALARGIRRWQLLAAKFLSMVLFIGAGLTIVALTIVPSSLVATSLAFDTGTGFADAGDWSTLAVMFGKAVYGLLPYTMLALFLSVLTSSPSMGIAFSLWYYFAEGVLVAILVGVFGGFDSVSGLLLGPATAAWMTETGIDMTYQGTLFAPLLDLPSEMRGFVVLTVYAVIAGVAAFALLQRKDIAGARGE